MSRRRTSDGSYDNDDDDDDEEAAGLTQGQIQQTDKPNQTRHTLSLFFAKFTHSSTNTLSETESSSSSFDCIQSISAKDSKASRLRLTPQLLHVQLLCATFCEKCKSAFQRTEKEIQLHNQTK